MKTIGIVIFIFLSGMMMAVLWAQSQVAQFKNPAVNGIVFFPDVLALAPRRKIRVVTYNLGYASGKKNGEGSVLSREEILKNLENALLILKTINADVVCLQEVDFFARRSHDMDQLNWLARKLGFAYAAYAVNWNNSYVPYPYWPPKNHFGRLVSGQGILSRYPLSEHQVTVFPKPPHAFWYNWFYLDRLAQKVTVTIGKDKISLWNVHLEAFHQETRIVQAKILRRLTDSDDRKLKIVAGDFNDPVLDSRDAVGVMTLEGSSWLREDKNSGQPFTFPSWEPREKIDHVLYNGGNFLLRGSGIKQNEASDHLPVWIDLAWRD